MRKLGLIVGMAVVIVLALALTVPALMDWSRFKAPLVERLQAATGRTVTLSGPIGLRLLPSPAISAERLTIANPAGMGGDFARVERLRAHVALLPLLTGTLRLTSLELDQPHLNLIRPTGKPANWDFGSPPEVPPGRIAPSQRTARPEPPPAIASDEALPVNEVVINNGRITYGDGKGPAATVSDLVARVRLGGLSGPFQADGAAKLNGSLISFEASLERMLPGRAAPISLKLRLPGDDARLAMQGMVTQLSGGQTLRAHVTLAAPDPRRSLSRLGLVPSLPAGELSVESDISASAQEASATNLVASIGDARATGAITAAFGAVPQVDAKLSIAALDLDKWSPLSGARAGTATPSPTTAPAPGPAPDKAVDGFNLPQQMFVSATLSVEALSWHGQVAREARLEAVLDQGEVMLRAASIQLPGNSTLTADGALAVHDGQPLFEGQLRLRSDNLRSLLAWAGATPAGIAESRLRNLDLTAPVRVEWPRISLPDFRLTLDNSHARGTLTARMAGRPALGLSAAIDSVNVDAYRPAKDSGNAPPAAAPRGDEQPAAGETASAAADSGFDAEIALKIQSLMAAGAAVEDVTVNALLQNGQLDLRQLSGVLAGTRASAQGRIAGMPGGTARLERLNVRVDSPQPARLLRALGTEGPNLPPLKLSATISGDTAGTVFDVSELSLTIGPSSVTGQGQVDFSGTKPAIAAELTAKELALDSLLANPRTGFLLPGGPRLPPFALPPGAQAIPVAAGAVGAGASPFTREPLNLAALQAFDARIGLQADAVTAKDWRLEQAVARLVVQDGTASLDSLTGKLLGGDLTASVKLSSAPRPALSGTLNVAGADLATAPLALGGGISVTRGKLTTGARFTATGQSTQDMAASLNGDGTLAVRDGTIEGFDLPAVNQRLNNIENIGSLLGVVQAGLAGGKTPFSQLSGTFRAENGVVTSDDIKLDAEGGGANAQTRVDLPRWTTSTAVGIHLANATQAPLGVRLEGTLDNPRKIIDVNALQHYLVSRGLGRALKNKDAGALLESLTGKSADQTSGDQPREKNTGKNILKNLLKGLSGQ